MGTCRSAMMEPDGVDAARSASGRRRSPQAAHGSGKRAGKQQPADGHTTSASRSSLIKRGASGGGVGPLIWSAAHQWTEANESESGTNSKLGVSALQRHMGGGMRGGGGDAANGHQAAALHSTSLVSMSGAAPLQHQLVQVQVQVQPAPAAAPSLLHAQAHAAAQAAAHYQSSFTHANDNARFKNLSSVGREVERAASAAAIYGQPLQLPAQSQSHQPPQHLSSQSNSGPSVFVYGRCNGTLPSGRTSRSASTASGKSLYFGSFGHPAGLQAPSSSSSSSPGVAVVEPVDCTEIEEWYDEDNADYMDYVRRWEEQKDAEAREAEEGAAMRVQRSLFFGLQLQQQKEAITAALESAESLGDDSVMAGMVSSRHHASTSSFSDSPSSLPHSPNPLSPRQVNLSALTLRPVQHIAQTSMLSFMAELIAESAQIGASHARVTSGINSGSGSFSSSSTHHARYSPIHFRGTTSLSAALALTTPADHIVSSRRSSRNYAAVPFVPSIAAAVYGQGQAQGHTHFVQVAPHAAHTLEELRVVD